MRDPEARLTTINECPPVAELLEHPHHQRLLLLHAAAVRHHRDVVLPAGAQHCLQAARQSIRSSALVTCRPLRDACKRLNHPYEGEGSKGSSRGTDLDEVGVVELEADGTL